MGGSKRYVKACFTGHRPEKFGGYAKGNPTQKAVKDELAKIIWDLTQENDITKFYSGMAIGVDTWAAEEVRLCASILNPERRHDIPMARLVAVIPFVGQQNRWPVESQLKWAELIHEADDLYFVDKEGYAPWKLLNRNKWMVDHSDIVIAVWDGSEKGGTAHCVRYAKKQKKKVINLWEPILKRLD